MDDARKGMDDFTQVPFFMPQLNINTPKKTFYTPWLVQNVCIFST